jgi:predicted small lipoprotein YifL
MKMRMRTALLVLAVTAVTACGADGSEPPSAEQTTTVSTAPATTESETSMPTNDQDQLPIVAPAIDDLARRVGATPEDIEIVSAEEVTWPDGSLGCPEPGMSYTQSLVDGSKVVLRYDDRVFVYHAGGDNKPFLCPSDEKDGGHEMVPPPGYNS